jgi:hypothetical protein
VRIIRVGDLFLQETSVVLASQNSALAMWRHQTIPPTNRGHLLAFVLQKVQQINRDRPF